MPSSTSSGPWRKHRWPRGRGVRAGVRCCTPAEALSGAYAPRFVPAVTAVPPRGYPPSVSMSLYLVILPSAGGPGASFLSSGPFASFRRLGRVQAYDLPATIHRCAGRGTVTPLSLSYRPGGTSPPCGFCPVAGGASEAETDRQRARSGRCRSSWDRGDRALAAEVDVLGRKQGHCLALLGEAQQAVADDGRRGRPRHLLAFASPQIHDQQRTPETTVRMERCPSGRRAPLLWPSCASPVLPRCDGCISIRLATLQSRINDRRPQTQARLRR